MSQTAKKSGQDLATAAGFSKVTVPVARVAAMAVAMAIDALQFSEVVGCIAGDDTIMVAVRTVEETRQLMNKMNTSRLCLPLNFVEHRNKKILLLG